MLPLLEGPETQICEPMRPDMTGERWLFRFQRKAELEAGQFLRQGDRWRFRTVTQLSSFCWTEAPDHRFQVMCTSDRPKIFPTSTTLQDNR